MPTKESILELVRLGKPYEEIAKDVGIPAGLAYLIATGLPADGGDVPSAEDLQREGVVPGSTQHLANPSTELPKHKDSTEEWMRGRARADSSMQEAAAVRTAEPPEWRADPDEVVDVLGSQHNEVNYLHQQLEAVPKASAGGTDADHRQRVSILDMLRIRLSEHEAVEEEYFWPAVRAELPSGAELAERALRQEQEGKDLLQALSDAENDPGRFDELVASFSTALRRHVAFEDAVFLRVRSELDEALRIELGTKLKRAISAAPTRQHPRAPARPQTSKFVNRQAALVDRTRDASGDRPAAAKERSRSSSEVDE